MSPGLLALIPVLWLVQVLLSWWERRAGLADALGDSWPSAAALAVLVVAVVAFSHWRTRSSSQR